MFVNGANNKFTEGILERLFEIKLQFRKYMQKIPIQILIHDCNVKLNNINCNTVKKFSY